MELLTTLRIYLVVNVKRNSEVSESGRGIEKDFTFSSRDRRREKYEIEKILNR